jgi:hypothetical protein
MSRLVLLRIATRSTLATKSCRWGYMSVARVDLMGLGTSILEPPYTLAFFLATKSIVVASRSSRV